MAWIEAHQSLWTHRKTLMLAAELGVRPTYAGGHLVRLWCWALDNAVVDFDAKQGRLTGLPDEVIATGADWDGDPAAFVGALIDTGWLECEGDPTDWRTRRLTLHDWWDYAGKYLDKRRANAERMRIARSGHAESTSRERATHVQRTSPARAGATVPNLTVPNPPATDVAGADQPTAAGPFELAAALLDELRVAGRVADDYTPSAGWKRKQCGIAKGLLAEGCTEAETRAIVKWLLSDAYWAERDVGLEVVAAKRDGWIQLGRPATAAVKEIRANGHRRIGREPSSQAELEKWKRQYDDFAV